MSLDTTFNSTALSTLGFSTHVIRGRDLGKQNRYSFDVPKIVGSIEVGKKFPANTLAVEGRLEGSSYSNLEATIFPAFLAALYSDEDETLVFNDKSTKYYNAQFDGLRIIKEESLFRILQVYFTCNDPLAYAVTPDTDSQTITALDSTFVLTNSGHYYAYPTITVTFNQDQSHFYIENQTIEDCRFDFSESFVSGDILIINSKTGVITLNGTAFYSGFGSGGDGAFQFIKLAFGASAANLICVGSDDATIDIDVDSSWEKTYLS